MDDHPKSIVLLMTPFRDGVAFKSPTKGAFFLNGWAFEKSNADALEHAEKYTPEGTEITVDHVEVDLPDPRIGGAEDEHGYGTDGVFEAEGVHIPFAGACPVQGDGEVDGFGCYYRSRGSGWALEIKIGGDEPWTYGEWDYVWPDGGWIHRDESMKNLAKAVQKFRERDTAK
jgi:hypothetical protein